MGQTFCCSAADILCMVLYTLFLWSDTPVHSQLMFCMPFCVWRYIPYVSMKRYVLHVQLLLRHLVLPSGNYFSAQSKQLKMKHKTSLPLNILWPLVTHSLPADCQPPFFFFFNMTEEPGGLKSMGLQSRTWLSDFIDWLMYLFMWLFQAFIEACELLVVACGI